MLQLAALFAALFVAVAWGSPASVEYLCSMSGERGTSCCCGPETEESDEGETAQRPSCCETRAIAAQTPHATSPESELPSLGAPEDAPLTSPAARQVFSPRSPVHEGLARGPPPAHCASRTYLRHRTLLI